MNDKSQNWHDAHREHLASDYWRDVRKAVWRRDRGCCTACGIEARYSQLDVDHENYSYWRRELEGLHTVRLLCRGCHKYRHGKSDINPADLSYEMLMKRLRDL